MKKNVLLSIIAIGIVVIIVTGVILTKTNSNKSNVEMSEGELGEDYAEDYSEENSTTYDLGYGFKIYDEEDYEQYQGKIDDILFGDEYDAAIYIKDTVYITYSYQDTQKWKIGENKKLVSFDGSALIVKNEDEVLTVYGTEGTNEETGFEMTKSMDLLCDLEHFAYGYHPIVSENFNCFYYDETGVLKFQKYDLLNQTAEQPRAVMYQIKDDIDADIIPLDKFIGNGYGAYYIIDNGVLMGAFDSYCESNNGAIYVTRKFDVLENVDKYFGRITGHVVSLIGDNENLWYKENESNLYQIKLPEGYSVNDISTVNTRWDILVMFNDGSCYNIETYNLTADSQNTLENAIDIEEFETWYNDGKVIRVTQDRSDLVVLMDDGYLYEVK